MDTETVNGITEQERMLYEWRRKRDAEALKKANSKKTQMALKNFIKERYLVELSGG